MIPILFTSNYIITKGVGGGTKPRKDQWVPINRTLILNWLINGTDPDHEHEESGVDGFFNSPYRTNMGAFGIYITH